MSDAGAIREVETVVRAFLDAFENLDMERFSSHFQEGAAMFFPSPEPPKRFEGKTAILERFRIVFDRIRAEAMSGPPFHRLEPKGLRVDLPAPDVSIVSFHLENVQRISRRTLILQKFESVWLIVHVHASNAEL